MIAVPFGGSSHDWPAVELAARLARSVGIPLCLVGRDEDVGADRRDASRLLARASLVVQEAIGVVAEPRLAPPGPDGMLAAAGDAALLVVGLSERWQTEGVGPTRHALVAGSRFPIVLVRASPDQDGRGPRHSFSRHAWSVAASP